MTEWIAIDDRLPNENEDVLLCCNDGSYMIGFYKREKTQMYQRKPYPIKWKSEYLVDDEMDEIIFTHWMPLPKPPENYPICGESECLYIPNCSYSEQLTIPKGEIKVNLRKENDD